MIKDPYPNFAQETQMGPVEKTEFLPGIDCWRVIGIEEARALLGDKRLSIDLSKSSCRDELAQVFPMGESQGVPILGALDPPAHTRVREPVRKAFLPGHIERLRSQVQVLVDDLVAEMNGDAEVDLVEEFAYPLPVAVICLVLGIPLDDYGQLRTWSEDMIAPPYRRGGPARRQEGTRNIRFYLAELIADTDLGAGPGSEPANLMGRLLRERGGPGEIGHEEIVSIGAELLLAGHVTTANLIANGMLLLLQDPLQADRLRRRPELIPGAVEEIMRYFSPVQHAMRAALEDIEVAGVLIPEGSLVDVLIGAANRDTTAFSRANTLDVGRDEGRHVAFGHGIHYCVGAPLARLEGQIALGTLLRRFPDMRLNCAVEELRWKPGGPLNGLASLPVLLGPRTD
jgi:cytochrome P450